MIPPTIPTIEELRPRLDRMEAHPSGVRKVFHGTKWRNGSQNVRADTSDTLKESEEAQQILNVINNPYLKPNFAFSPNTLDDGPTLQRGGRGQGWSRGGVGVGRQKNALSDSCTERHARVRFLHYI